MSKATVRLLNGASYELEGDGLRVVVTGRYAQASRFDKCTRRGNGEVAVLPSLLSAQWPMAAVEAVLYGG